MRLFITLLVMACLFTLKPEKTQAQQDDLSVNFDKNVELMGYLIHLVDPDDNDPNHPISVELNSYPEDRQLPVLGDILAIAGNMDYATIIRLFYTLPDFPLSETYEVPASLLNSFGYEAPSEQDEIRLLIQSVDQFTKESGFKKLWENLKPYRESTKVMLNQNKPSEALIHEMETFYQQAFDAYHIIPSLTLWAGPGWGFKTDNEKVATFVLGPIAKNYNYSDIEALRTLSVHEFGHSFVNTVVLEHAQNEIAEMPYLYTPIQDNMTRQGYGNWASSLVEHFVRAGELIIAEQMGNHDLKDQLQTEFVKEREFLYLPFIVDTLKKYRFDEGLSYEESVELTLQDLKTEYAE